MKKGERCTYMIKAESPKPGELIQILDIMTENFELWVLYGSNSFTNNRKKKLIP